MAINPVRAPQPSPASTSTAQNAFEVAKQQLGQNASSLKVSGNAVGLAMDDGVPNDVNCANFVTGVLEASGQIDHSQHTNLATGVGDNLERDPNWERVGSINDAKPGDVVVMDTGSSNHVVMFAGWQDGKVGGQPLFIGSNNANADGSQKVTISAMNYSIMNIHHFKGGPEVVGATTGGASGGGSGGGASASGASPSGASSYAGGSGSGGGGSSGVSGGGGNSGGAQSSGGVSPSSPSAGGGTSNDLLMQLLAALAGDDPDAIAQALGKLGMSGKDAKKFAKLLKQNPRLAKMVQANPKLAQALAQNPELLKKLEANPKAAEALTQTPEIAKALAAGNTDSTTLTTLLNHFSDSFEADGTEKPPVDLSPTLSPADGSNANAALMESIKAMLQPSRA